MIRSIVWTVVFGVVAIILQSAVIGMIPIFEIKPDLLLCVIVFSAYVNGTMTGQVSGFFAGLMQDFLSQSPLGLNCLVRTVIGALAGLFKGAFFLDLIFMPAILCALATLLKALVTLLLHLFMGSVIPNPFVDTGIWVELGLNSLFAPLLFLLLKNFKPIYAGRG
ncbi:MAG: rod shape-determining protein MreD [Treponema sp.]|nr:rod shape-determining protein MreD [Treponema sp.]